MEDKWVIPRDSMVEMSAAVLPADVDALEDYLWSRGVVCGSSGVDHRGLALVNGHMNGNIDGRREDLDSIRAYIENLNKGAGEVSFRETCSLDRERWRDSFKIINVSDRLTIKPCWEKMPPMGPDVIEIDPDMAFGTGVHETTSMCLKLLVEMVEEGISILDVGTGTGILAIVAARLGASSVSAIDFDERAEESAAKNIAANGLSSKIKVIKKNISEIDMQFDAVVANVLSIDLIGMAKDIGRNLKPGGWAVLSGVRRKFLKEVVETYGEQGMELERVINDGEWLSPVMRKVA